MSLIVLTAVFIKAFDLCLVWHGKMDLRVLAMESRYTLYILDHLKQAAWLKRILICVIFSAQHYLALNKLCHRCLLRNRWSNLATNLQDHQLSFEMFKLE